MKRWVHALSGIPWVSTTTRVMGEKQIATFEAMCERTGRKPHELASDIVLGELWENGDNPGLRRIAREQRRWRRQQMSKLPIPVGVSSRPGAPLPGREDTTSTQGDAL